MKSQYVSLQDASWKSEDRVRGDVFFHIPTSFICKLLDGDIHLNIPDPNQTVHKLEQMMHDGLAEFGFDVLGSTRRMFEQFTERVGGGFIDDNLRFSDECDLLKNLEEALLRIIYLHDHHGDDSDLSQAIDALEKTGHPHLMAQAYLVGRGLCMHVASLGVAISRANGVPSRIIGNPDYFSGYGPPEEPNHHYGFQVWVGGRWHNIIPRSGAEGFMRLLFFRRLRNFTLIEDHPLKS